MIYVACIAFGMGIMWLAQHALRRSPEIAERFQHDSPVAAIRWERVGGAMGHGALRHLRRHRPTHDLLTNVRFLEIVRPKGNAAAVVSRRCSAWTVAVVLVDKRTGSLDRVVLENDDVDLEEKKGILKRTGLKVLVMSPAADEDEVVAALAA